MGSLDDLFDDEIILEGLLPKPKRERKPKKPKVNLDYASLIRICDRVLCQLHGKYLDMKKRNPHSATIEIYETTLKEKEKLQKLVQK